MIIEDIIIKKITPEKGYLLTNGETVTDALLMGESESFDAWWEIPDENYVSDDDSDYFDIIVP